MEKTDNITSNEYREWILQQPQDEYTLHEESPKHLSLNTDFGRSDIKFYPDEIVEFSITDFKTDDVKYYLHFQLHDREHAEGLFDEMREALVSLKEQRTLKILFSCSSGFTTSYFAEKMNEAAHALELDYHFDAVSYLDIYDIAENYDIILIAPQIGYMLKNLSASLPDKLILQIPTTLFAAYDSAEMIRFVQDQVEVLKKKGEPEPEKICTCCSYTKKTVLLFAQVYDGPKVRLWFQVRRGDQTLLEDYVLTHKAKAGVIFDSINYALAQVKKIDLIALALPGLVTDRRTVELTDWDDYKDIVPRIEERYAIPCFIENNTNAAAIGYAHAHPEYQSVTVVSQPYGKANGGQGSVVSGRLISGKGGIAGESKFYLERMQFSNTMTRLARSSEGQLELIVNSVLPTIALLGPEVMIMRTPMVSDMTAVRHALKSFLPERSLPELVYVSNISDLIFVGLTQLCIDYFAEHEKKDKA